MGNAAPFKTDFSKALTAVGKKGPYSKNRASVQSPELLSRSWSIATISACWVACTSGVTNSKALFTKKKAWWHFPTFQSILSTALAGSLPGQVLVSCHQCPVYNCSKQTKQNEGGETVVAKRTFRVSFVALRPTATTSPPRTITHLYHALQILSWNNSP